VLQIVIARSIEVGESDAAIPVGIYGTLNAFEEQNPGARRKRRSRTWPLGSRGDERFFWGL